MTERFRTSSGNDATRPNDSTIEQTAQVVGEIVETGATLVGRGLAAGVEGMGQLANRAAEMTGINSPASAGKAAESATRSTMTAARSVRKGCSPCGALDDAHGQKHPAHRFARSQACGCRSQCGRAQAQRDKVEEEDSREEGGQQADRDEEQGAQENGPQLAETCREESPRKTVDHHFIHTRQFGDRASRV